MAADFMRYKSLGVDSTEALAAALGRSFVGGELIALDGDLGAGKTAFVRGLARGLDVTDPVSSPSFTLMQEYAGRLVLRHFDAWMETRERSFLSDGGGDALEGDAVCAIEWAGRVEDWLPEPYLHVGLRHLAPEERLVELKVVGEGADRERLIGILEALEPIPGLESVL